MGASGQADPVLGPATTPLLSTTYTAGGEECREGGSLHYLGRPGSQSIEQGEQRHVPRVQKNSSGDGSLCLLTSLFLPVRMKASIHFPRSPSPGGRPRGEGGGSHSHPVCSLFPRGPGPGHPEAGPAATPRPSRPAHRSSPAPCALPAPAPALGSTPPAAARPRSGRPLGPGAAGAKAEGRGPARQARGSEWARDRRRAGASRHKPQQSRGSRDWTHWSGRCPPTAARGPGAGPSGRSADCRGAGRSPG